MRIAVDGDKCIASGACVIAAPNVFAQDEDGIVVVLKEVPEPQFEAEAQAAIRACPASVIWDES
jgi:ferredoxin